MNSEISSIIEHYTFLNPVYTTYDNFVVSNINTNFLNSSFVSSENVFTNTLNQDTQEVELKLYYFHDGYVKYELESEILTEFYKIVNILRAKDLSFLSNYQDINSLDEHSIANSIKYNILKAAKDKILSYYSYIVVSPAIHYYLSLLPEFVYVKPTNIEAFRCVKVGHLFSGNITVYVDYYMQTDLIICGRDNSINSINNYLTLYYSNHYESNSIKFKLVINNPELFKQSMCIIKDYKYHDPMETDLTNVNITDFF